MVVWASRFGLYEHTSDWTIEVWYQKPSCLRRGRLTWSTILRVKFKYLRRELKLAIEHSQASMMNATRDMIAEFTRDNGRSESGSAEGSATIGQIPRGIVPTAVTGTPAAAVGMARDIGAVAETTLREGASPDLGATGRGGTALPV